MVADVGLLPLVTVRDVGVGVRARSHDLCEQSRRQHVETLAMDRLSCSTFKHEMNQ